MTDRRTRLLDLFCGAGGAARGYQNAGYYVVGIDNRAQPRYAGDEFHQADALEYVREHGQEFDAIHASPPCQHYSALHHFCTRDHGDHMEASRSALEATGRPYVIENVPGAPMRTDLMLCGSMFGLRTPCGAELRRHRLFETNWPIVLVPQCQHGIGSARTISIMGGSAEGKRTMTLTDRSCQTNVKRTISVYGEKARDRRTISICGDNPRDPAAERRKYRAVTVTGSTAQQNVERNRIRELFPVSSARIAMGIDWMTMRELSQAIPPAYTEWIGAQLMDYLRGEGRTA